MSELNITLNDFDDVALPAPGEVVAVMLTGVFSNQAKETNNTFLSFNGIVVTPEYSGAPAKRSPVMLAYTNTWAAKKHPGASPAFLKSIAHSQTNKDQKSFLSMCQAMFGAAWDDMYAAAGNTINPQLLASMVGRVFWAVATIESYRDEEYVSWKVVKGPTSLEELGLVGGDADDDADDDAVEGAETEETNY